MTTTLSPRPSKLKLDGPTRQELRDGREMLRDNGLAARHNNDQLEISGMSALAQAFTKAGRKMQTRERMRRYVNDPVLWAKERLNVDLWSAQGEVGTSLVENKKTIVKSCHAIGKTFLAAVLVCWWIDTHPPEETRVVTTAPTAYQVNKLMWEYIRKLHRNNDLPGDVTEASEWKSDERDVIGIGRKPADTNIHGFQGVHATYVLAVIDEACGVPQQIWTGVEAITTSDENRVLAIGNPDDPGTEFGRIFSQNDPSWAKFTVSAFDTPNFTGEHKTLPKEVCQNLISVSWVDEKRKSWGEDSSRYKAKVLAVFPSQSTDTLFPTAVLTEVLGTGDEIVAKRAAAERPVFGVDVARFGTDLSTIVMNYGGEVTVIDSWSKTDTVESARKVHDHAVKLGVGQVRVDATGIGVGVVDQLRVLCGEHYEVYEMVGSAAAPDNRRWVNARAFWHDHVLGKMKAKEMSLPSYEAQNESDEQQLYEELEGLRYKFNKGSMQIESKDEMRAQGRKSPNFSDALMYAMAPVDDESLLSRHDVGDVVTYDPWMDYGNYVIAPV